MPAQRSGGYKRGLRDACRIMEFHLWHEGRRTPLGNPAWEPYLAVRYLLYKQSASQDAFFIWDGKPLAEANKRP
jgi:hypothetical protein